MAFRDKKGNVLEIMSCLVSTWFRFRLLLCMIPVRRKIFTKISLAGQDKVFMGSVIIGIG